MRYLVTGAAGFVGSRLVSRLVASGDEVTGTYIGRRPELGGVRLRELDLLEGAALTALVEETDPQVIIHLAGLSHVGESWQALADYFQVNVLGTELLLEAAAGRRVVMASSAEVYGLVPEEEQPMAEARRLAPQSPYALTKAAAERLVLPRGGIVVRSFNILGPGQTSNFALPAFAAQLAAIRAGRQEAVLKVGNLVARRDFVHLDDAVEGYLAVAARGEDGVVYNLGSGEAHSIGEMLERLVSVSGIAARIEIDPQRFRPVDLPLLQADAGRLRGLGWSSRRSLDSALEELWRSLGDQGD
jgi:GDP-4-dehydro-6-deoxy-D-mannose reductase